MFLEYKSNMGHDFTFCSETGCKEKNCARHPNHWPVKATFVSVSNYGLVCCKHIANFEVLQHIQMKGYVRNEIQRLFSEHDKS